MKAHAYRLLRLLPLLATSPLVKRVNATFGHETVTNILEAEIDLSSIFVLTQFSLEEELWRCFDRDSLISLDISIDKSACEQEGIQPTLEGILNHLDDRVKRTTA